MENESGPNVAVCSKEAIDLLNCVTESPFDQNKCLTLLDSLRQCVQSKKVKKFTLAEEGEGVAKSKSKDGSSTSQ